MPQQYQHEGCRLQFIYHNFFVHFIYMNYLNFGCVGGFEVQPFTFLTLCLWMLCKGDQSRNPSSSSCIYGPYSHGFDVQYTRWRLKIYKNQFGYIMVSHHMVHPTWKQPKHDRSYNIVRENILLAISPLIIGNSSNISDKDWVWFI
jgi:hypothetical protein